jgi:hypothetical protein
VHLQMARCRSGPAPPAQQPSQPGERQRVTSRARRREDDGTTRPNELKQRTRMLSAPIVAIRTACSHARCTISPVLCCARPMSQTLTGCRPGPIDQTAVTPRKSLRRRRRPDPQR